MSCWRCMFPLSLRQYPQNTKQWVFASCSWPHYRNSSYLYQLYMKFDMIELLYQLKCQSMNKSR